ncbi:PREDICTED: uncharacterized protein LOC18611289 isoform X3 [Theobroma cacao]|uniref:Uncharacterized protein LOC18611289 isoform X3 n=1 Tax=Theobroma cacao TaxID=3641 RepID=A0AB32VPS2_THECC|nr:PREDICTED: uncharacterized protein LOC18611289 isoform X3 [Theobroma cacao]
MQAVIAEALAMKGPRPTSSGSSSGEEDGDAEWKAAIQSIAAATTAIFTPNGFNTSFSNSSTTTTITKAKTTRNSSVSRPTLDTLNDDADDGEKKQQPQKLKHFQIKMIFNDPQRDQKSFLGEGFMRTRKRRQLRSIAVDGKDILAAARQSSQKSLARLEAKDAAAKEKAKREEERVAELKRIRGERWLPSVAREMQLNRSSDQQV